MAPRVSQLMTAGAVQTLSPGAGLSDIAASVRRVAHSCWPVLENGQLVGVLLRRDLDRALEHELGGLTVRDIMRSDFPHLREDDGLTAAEAALGSHGHACLPVVDAAGDLKGMVSRGDLLRYRLRGHFTGPAVKLEDLPHAALIERMAQVARGAGIALWLVGGSVRDILLGRPGDDLDLVVEGTPRRMAGLLQASLGGALGPPSAFGTLRWFPDEITAGNVTTSARPLPRHVDLAGARCESYAAPAALPEVFSGSLAQDLGRRDFSINALAIPVAPEAGPLIDPYGGLADLEGGVIRVLHPLSFHDDPLRILRAWRFSSRFGFGIEPRTAELMQVARPALGRITGTRLRNELDLVMREDRPGAILLTMQESGLLSAMHPDFRVAADADRRLSCARHNREWADCPDDRSARWHALVSDVDPDRLPSLCQRLQIAPELAKSMEAAARVLRDPGILAEGNATMHRIAERLLRMPVGAVCCVAQLAQDAALRRRLQDWLHRWPQTRPFSTGHDVLAAGVPPGPAIARILLALRVAWFEGSVASHGEERELLARLVAAELQDDDNEAVD